MSEETEESVDDIMRSPQEVARRCCVLSAVIAVGHHRDAAPLLRWLTEEGLLDSLSPMERQLLESPSPDKQQKIEASWRAEALHALLWALGKIDPLLPPSQQCNLAAEIAALPHLTSTSEFIAAATLRDEGTIHDILGEICHVHWEVRDARLRDLPVPNGYISGAVYERHYAYNWLTGYCGQDWDDITTDT